MTDKINKLNKILDGKNFERKLEFQQTLILLKKEQLKKIDIDFLITLYPKLREPYNKHLIMYILERKQLHELKDFFFNVFKKECYLELKIEAMRGYAIYATEKEVEILMKNFIIRLEKLPKLAPYCYTEYEPIISEYGLPYLIKNYNYQIFIDSYNISMKQYNAMPDTFKGIFTVNADGECVSLLSKEEVANRFENFFGKYNL